MKSAGFMVAKGAAKQALGFHLPRVSYTQTTAFLLPFWVSSIYIYIDIIYSKSMGVYWDLLGLVG